MSTDPGRRRQRRHVVLVVLGVLAYTVPVSVLQVLAGA